MELDDTTVVARINRELDLPSPEDWVLRVLYRKWLRRWDMSYRMERLVPAFRRRYEQLEGR